MYIVSACLLGVCCKYSGGHNDSEEVRKFLRGKRYMALCPETMGGLKSPRPPAEIIDGRVVDREGRDLTEAFQKGAAAVYEKALLEAEAAGEAIEMAILKARSPSCGEGKIYDGSFSGTLTDGDGFLTALLKEKGIPVITEESLPAAGLR